MCVIIAPFLLKWLYPEWAAESCELIYITTASAVISAINTIIRPAILRFRNTKWQFWIGGSNAVLYVVLALVFIQIGGLKGFCYGLLINSIVQLIFRTCIFWFQPSESIKTISDI